MTNADEQFNFLKPQNISLPLFQLIMALLKTRHEIISNIFFTLTRFRTTHIFKRKISIHLIVTFPLERLQRLSFCDEILKICKTPRCKALLEKITFPWLDKKIPTLTKIKYSLPFSLKPAFFTKARQLSPSPDRRNHPTSSNLCLGLVNLSFRFLHQNSGSTSSPALVPHAPPTSSSMI